MTQIPMAAPAPPADLRALTALRFIAAMWVALFAFWPNLDVAVFPNLVAKGYLGVELFFVLSGFILCHVYLEPHGEKRFSYRGFLWARIARVYPLHVATLLGVGALAVAALAAGMSVDGNILSWASLPANLTMMHAWGLAPEAGWNHPSWSISAEWFAYLGFPAFAVVAWSLRHRPILAVFGAVVFLAALYAAFEPLAGFPLTQATIAWGALRIVPCFALGCALYLLFRRSPLKTPWLAAFAAVLLIAISATLTLPDAVTVTLFGLLILSLASLANDKAGWLASRPAVYLGEISYSVYMVVVPWKLLAVNVAARLTDAGPDKSLPVLVWLAVMAGLPVVAALSYHLVEYPARRALRRMGEGANLGSKKRQTAQPAI
ncbi:peptidoglycan/LPS O-acetylase OafA/YrhL [Brevundimonas variabilis]|uniref:Peptidoglycan/LPS O-acetylase OafA/YrhL n=2 Tax=Brevundimonas variabilis TaxID=74312 RepID=A0A7W9CKV7_9CAUL|nr:acyltransferase [Brevundimonas variabilis]MBB5747349.1 peptidoglycan/LPS O-acetylase OafA/YrhL [Brevundimonas variabilis]